MLNVKYEVCYLIFSTSTAKKHKKSNKKSKQHKVIKQQDVQQPAPVCHIY